MHWRTKGILRMIPFQHRLSDRKKQEARRDDDNFCHVAAWEYTGDDTPPAFYKEPLVFENVELSQRSYK
ncbi:MAG: hypothetical protein R2861_02815 [Desulfobacterales bacterium]